MALISDFTRHFEDRVKIYCHFSYTNDFFLHVSFSLIGYPPEHPFCSDGFSLGVRFDHRLVADNGGGQIGSTHPLSATGWARTVAAVYQAVAARKVLGSRQALSMFILGGR
jgi:hypothetical protein